MALKVKAMLIRSAISLALIGLTWVFELFYFLKWITFPGGLLSWGTIALLHGENWKNLRAIGITLLTVTMLSFTVCLSFSSCGEKQRARKRHSGGP